MQPIKNVPTGGKINQWKKQGKERNVGTVSPGKPSGLITTFAQKAETPKAKWVCPRPSLIHIWTTKNQDSHIHPSSLGF